jgi:predicted peroxiredoxin
MSKVSEIANNYADGQNIFRRKSVGILLDKVDTLQSTIKELIKAGNKMTVYTEGLKHSQDWRDLVSKIEQPSAALSDKEAK